MSLLFWRKKKRGTPNQRYKGIAAHCFKHPFAARCLCNRCLICIEEETGMTMGSVTYGGELDSGLLICNKCLETHTDEELAEHYTMFSGEYWHKPVAFEVVLASLKRKLSHSAIKQYKEDGKLITEVTNLDTGAVSRSWSEKT